MAGGKGQKEEETEQGNMRMMPITLQRAVLPLW
jgi:hypothetical protein